MTETPAFKIVLAGSGGCGKTSWVRRHLTGQFSSVYVPTVGVKVHPLVYRTTRGKVRIDFWDTAGQPGLAGLRDGYYVGAHAAIFFFDTGSRASYDEIGRWVRDFENVAGSDKPRVLCGNKFDLQEDPGAIVPTVQRDLRCLYYPISALSFYNYEKPILEILRRLLDDPDLQFVEEVPQPLLAKL